MNSPEIATDPAIGAPRKRDSARTREAILHAARKLFARDGFSAAGIREVGAEAGVNSSLVRRYFSSKEGLFREALRGVLTIQPFIDGPRKDFGRRAAALLTLSLEDMPNPLSMMLLATADTAAREYCRDLLHEKTITPLADWLGGPDAEARAAQLTMLWTGFMVARQIVPLQPVVDSDDGPAITWLRDTTQAIADQYPPD